jgi:hypothetical protein
MVRFLAELSLRTEHIIATTPSNGIERQYNIYEVDIGKPAAQSYWTDWEGYYDEYTGTKIELYYGRFLLHVFDIEEVKLTAFSIYIDETMVYFNIPMHPWLYPGHAAEGEDIIPFLSSPLNPDRPSNNIVRGYPASIRLEIPNFSIKLSETISGVILNQGFSVTLHNNDGFFDDEDKWDLFNTPIHLKKSTQENPQYEDFKTIRDGIIESVRSGFDSFHIEAADKIRSMDEPVCAIVTQEIFSGIALLDETAGKNIPVIYGTKRIKPIALNGVNMYLLAEEVSAVSNIADKDGNIITGWNTNTKIGGYTILTITKEGYPKPESAMVTGYTKNKIGEIVKSIVAGKTNVQYIKSLWNIVEVEAYISISPRVNIMITGGSVKKAVQDVIKNDMAYFIQQIDGRFSIRKWGEIYANHEIEAWMITKKPEKDYLKAQENYFSSCVINYNRTDNETYDSFYYDERENEAEDRYRKRLRKEYDTDLINENEVMAFARLVGGRYITMRPSPLAPPPSIIIS